MKLGFASDHAGYELKQYLIEYVKTNNINDIKFEIIDYGCNNESRVDYPDYIKKACVGIINKEVDLSIVVCGSGIGASIVANKIKGIRCALCHDNFTAEFSRRHNDANVLALGGRLLGKDLASYMIKIFLTTPFEGGRHKERLDKISAIETSC